MGISDTLVRFDISDCNYAISQADLNSKQGCVFIGDDIKSGDLRIKLLPINLEHPGFGRLRKAATR